MAGHGAPKGNQYAAKSRDFERRMRVLCVQEDWKRVHMALNKVLNLAAEGERWAVEVLRDTLDGRPAPQINIDLRQQPALGDMVDQELYALLAERRRRRDSGGTLGPPAIEGEAAPVREIYPPDIPGGETP